MKIEHRIGLNVGWREKDILKSYGIILEEGFQTFIVDESNQYWEEISRLIKVWKASDVVQTRFTKSELETADYLALYPKWLNDFPQPEESYLNESYDLKTYCSSCGVGKVQKSSIRIKGEPKWGKNLLFSLNWIFDEVFVERGFYSRFLKPLGIESREVVVHKRNSISESTVQLVLPVTEASLNLDQYPFLKCAECDSIKYLPINKGFFPPFNQPVEYPIFKSKEYFGSGASADQRIFVGSKLRDVLISNKANVTLYPSEKQFSGAAQ